MVRLARAASLVVLVGVLYGCDAAEDTRPQPAFSSALSELDSPRAFTVPRDGRYEVQLNFPWAGLSEEAKSIIDRAGGPAAPEPALPIDFDLNISVGGDPVIALSGHPRIVGTVDHMSSGLGAGSVQARGFIVGHVDLRAGAPYQISAVVREIAPALKAGAPLIRIDAATRPLG
jgi:hypothetical protein